MLENQIVEDFTKSFPEFISRIGGNVQTIQREPTRPGPDLFLRAQIRGTPITLIAEAKSKGEPRYIRQAVDQLREYIGRFPGAYPIVVSTFISPQTAEILKSRDIGYFDLAGNVLLDFGPLFSSVSGKPNRDPVQKTLKSLF